MAQQQTQNQDMSKDCPLKDNNTTGCQIQLHKSQSEEEKVVDPTPQSTNQEEAKVAQPQTNQKEPSTAKSKTFSQLKSSAPQINLQASSSKLKMTQKAEAEQTQSYTSQQQMVPPTVNPHASTTTAVEGFRKTLNLSSIGRSGSSFQPVPNAVSSSNISMNTSCYKGNKSNTVDEEDNLNFTSEDEEVGDYDEIAQVAMVDSCFNMRFVKHNDCISKSKYRTIHRGYDNESGCEIAWTTYPLHKYKRDRLLKALDQVKKLGQAQEQHSRNILHVFYNEVRKLQANAATTKRQQFEKSKSAEVNHAVQAFQGGVVSSGQTNNSVSQHQHQQEELIVVTELITAGSIREYLKKIKSLRLNVIRNWCQKVLEALQFLHEHDIVHGELSCETIYINSNNGEIKLGDVGIKHIHTSIRSHELGSCKLYLKEKDTLKVDVFCFGLTLLEIVASTESDSSKFTLKYMIRMLNQGRKNELLSKLLYDPMKDFLANALISDPEKRFGIQQLLQHPFLQQKSATDNKNFTKLSEGISELIKEQAAYFKSQRAMNNKSKNSNSLHLSVLNDSVQKKHFSSNQKATVKGTTNLAQSSCSDVKQESQMTIDKSSSIDKHLGTEESQKRGGLHTKINQTVEKPIQAPQTNPSLPSQPGINKERAFVPTIEQSLATNLLGAPKEINANLVQSSKSSNVITARRKSLFKQKGKTMTYLDVMSVKQSLIRHPIKHIKPSLQQDEHRVQGGGFPSSTYPSASSRRKMSNGMGNNSAERHTSTQKQASATTFGIHKDLLKGDHSSSNNQRNSNPSDDIAQQVQVQNVDAETQPDQNELQMSVQSQISPTQTQTNSENILFFRIQIQMKGRKSDVKFPFDLIKDSPEAVANELQDYFVQNHEGLVLPSRAIEAIRQEIQLGIDCHNQMQQPTLIEGSQAAQTQHSYSNTRVIKQREDGFGRSKFGKQKSSFHPAHHTDQIQRQQVEEEEKRREAEQIEAQQRQQLIEEKAQKQEQEAMELQLAHDYLSGCAQVDCFDISHFETTSLPLLETSESESQDFTAASMHASLQKLLKDGLIEEQNYHLMMLQQQQVRKVSISHNSNEQQVRQQPNGYYYNYCEEDFSNQQPHPATQMIKLIDLIEEPQTEYQAAVIEFEPQIPHNNTTGERHEKLIEEQQKNGPFGQQDILGFRNSVGYNDPVLNDFMNNPDEDKKRHKDKKCCQSRDSAKSEAQESLWLLRELFPGYMEKYHEDYVNNQVNTNNALTVHQSSSAADIHTSQYTIDLSLLSFNEASNFMDQLHKDVSNHGPSEPFQLDLSLILPDQQLQGATITQHLAQAPADPEALQPGVKPVMITNGVQVACDSSSQHLQIPSDLDEAQAQKNIAQQQVNKKMQQVITHHRSFMQDCSESYIFIKDLVCYNNSNMNLANSLHKRDFQHIQRPPSGQSVYNMPQIQGNTLSAKLNNSQHYNQVQSFHSHFNDPQKVKNTTMAASQLNAKTSLTGTINEIQKPTTSSHNSGVTMNLENLQRTQEVGRAAIDNKTTFDVQLSSQISDSQNSNNLTHRQLRTSHIQQAITYVKDQAQIQVISSSLENSNSQHHQQQHDSTDLNSARQSERSTGGSQTTPLYDRRNQASLPSNKVHHQTLTQSKLQTNLQCTLRTTPSVIDIDRLPVFDQAESALKEKQSHHAFLQQRRQNSMKGFMAMIDPIQKDSQPINKLEIDEENEESEDSPLQKVCKTMSKKQKKLELNEEVKQSEIASPSIRINVNNSGVKDLQQVQTTDINRLREIQLVGLRSSRLEKGFKEMKKSDITNLQFALNILGFCCIPQSQSEIDSSNASQIDISNNSHISKIGHFSKLTGSQVKKFKKSEGLQSNKIVDQETFQLIIEKAIQNLQKLKNSVGPAGLESVQEQEEFTGQASDINPTFSNRVSLPQINVYSANGLNLAGERSFQTLTQSSLADSPSPMTANAILHPKHKTQTQKPVKKGRFAVQDCDQSEEQASYTTGQDNNNDNNNNNNMSQPSQNFTIDTSSHISTHKTAKTSIKIDTRRKNDRKLSKTKSQKLAKGYSAELPQTEPTFSKSRVFSMNDNVQPAQVIGQSPLEHTPKFNLQVKQVIIEQTRSSSPDT